MLLNHPVTLEELVCRVIPVFESFSPRPFFDVLGKRWTIAYGRTKGITAETKSVTTEQAEHMMIEDCQPLFRQVGTNRPMLEAAMLIDFGYNCGPAALAKLLDGRVTFQNYGRSAGGVYSYGLIHRRQFEEIMVRLSRQLTKENPLIIT